jgi:hypothetical protein
MIFDRACTLSAQRDEGKPRSYVPQEVSHVNTIENTLSVSNNFFDQDQNMMCQLNNKGVSHPALTRLMLLKNLASAKLSVVNFLFIHLLWALLICSVQGWAAPSDDPQEVSASSEAQIAQDDLGPLSFTVVDVRRPVTRWGRKLSSPRYIYLMASRPPSRSEARRLAKNERRALRKSRRGRKSRRASREREIQPSSAARMRPWEGRRLNVYRLGPAEAQEIDAQAHNQLENRMRKYEQRLIDDRDARLAELSSDGSPIALSTPKASADLLESSDDDDELSGAEEGEICGHQGEPCCQTTKRASCDTGLMCVKNSCQPPPKPCGGFEQECCAEGPDCYPRFGLVCLSDQGGGQSCLIPPPLPERLKSPVGVVEVVEVRGSLVKAIVRSDALKPRRRKSRSLNAIYLGDEATWYR